ncbi:citrate/2-methylcitrate synthase [Actinospongicola halichondriae]|uniref:citrate/2-methylcitrate synthase n=1 Tax=Actinospongicola halichondriae TaxID=3236844 RepID=UPI003D5465B2
MVVDPWMTSEQASRRLEVKPETLYAYVSRGLIRSEKVPGQRRSRFLRADVERHASRSRRGGRTAGLEVVVETQLTLLEPSGHLYYRGWDVADAVAEASFEEIASWLWTGTVADTPFVASESAVAVARSAVDAVGDLPPIDRFRTALAVMRHADPFRADRRPSAVADTGRSTVAAMVECLDVLGRHDAPDGAPLAARLWARITDAKPSASRVRFLDAVLVLLADHELASSTFAARVAASTWADPYLVFQAGLAVLGGPLHGGASEQARQLLREAGETSAAEAIGRRLGNGDRIPGFGHRVYESSDPRADVVFQVLGPDDVPCVVPEILAVMDERKLPFPNIDFALAAAAETYGFADGATEAVFAVARTVGWLAHAIEEYEHALRFRPRAAYVGSPPRNP